MSDNSSVTSELRVENNVEKCRFQCSVGEELSVLEYSIFPCELVLLHTGVPASLRGRGIASELTRTALEFARSQHLTVVARCAFVSDYIDRHPEFGDVLKTSAKSSTCKT